MDPSTLALADALANQSVQQGEATPTVRGADWRYGTVSAVGTDGTVDCGPIRARRLPQYTQATIGDRCILLRSGTGNWIAMPPLASGPPGGTGGWTNIPLASGYGAAGSGITPGYLVEGRRVYLRGRVGPSSGTIANAATIGTLPVGARPHSGANPFSWSAARDTNVYPAVVRVEITTAGVIRTFETGTPLPSWISLDGVTYTT